MENHMLCTSIHHPAINFSFPQSRWVFQTGFGQAPPAPNPEEPEAEAQLQAGLLVVVVVALHSAYLKMRDFHQWGYPKIHGFSSMDHPTKIDD